MPSRPDIVGVLRNSLHLIVGNLGRTVLLLFLSLYVVRYLGREQFGVLGLAQAYSTIFSVVVTFGCKSLLVREMALHPEQAEEKLNEAVSLSCILSLLAYAAAFFFLRLLGLPEETRFLVQVLALQLLWLPLSLIRLLFQARLEQSYQVHAENASAAFYIACVLLFIHFQAGLVWFLAALLATPLVQCLGFLWAANRRMGYRLRLRWSPTTWKALLKECLPLLVIEICIALYMRADHILLAHVYSVGLVGVYAACTKLVEALNIFADAFSGSLLSPLSQAYREDRETFWRLCDRSFRYLLTFIVPVCVWLSFGAGVALRILFGPEFIAGVDCLRVLVWSELFVYTGILHFQMSVATRDQGLYVYITGFAAILNIALNLVLIPRYGIVGAALASTLAYGSIIPQKLFFPVLRPFSLMILRNLLRPLLAALGMSAVLYFWPRPDSVWDLIPAGLASGALYLALLLGLRTFSLAELRALLRTLLGLLRRPI